MIPPKATITLMRDFAEDRRTSMGVYADNLAAKLRELSGNCFELREYTPKLSRWVRLLPESVNLRMRAARYLDYPHQARKLESMLFHILDHGYAHLLPSLRPEKTIVTVHDLIPVLAGKGKIKGISLPRRSWLAEYSSTFYRKAAHIITVSENTKKDLINYCNCPPDKISVIYLGISDRFFPVSKEEKVHYRKILGLPSFETRLVLITGQQHYKNHVTGLRVMENLQKQFGSSLKLVRVGRLTPEWSALLQNSNFKDNVISFEYLAPSEVPNIYNAVDCLLFPSWYEGFGLPPVEAMACGTPVVSSNAASLPEAVGQVGLTLEPDDAEGMAKALQRLLTDNDYREQQRQKGIEHSRRFSWNENAEKTLEIYMKVLKSRSAQ